MIVKTEKKYIFYIIKIKIVS